MKRGAALQRRTALKRRRRRELDRDGARAWALAARLRPCVMCGQWGTQGHHIIRQQVLRHLGPAQLGKVRWDRRNLLPLCAGCHASHHAARRRITRRVLRVHAPDVWDFAADLGLVWALERDYPEDPS